MKKILAYVLTLAVLLSCISVTATADGQMPECRLFEDFEASPDGWMIYDEDGDDHNWTLKKDAGYSYSGSGFVVSQSYINDIGEVTPDNWLVSPAFTPHSSDELRWMIAAMDAKYPYDAYSVYVLEEGYLSPTDGDEIYKGYANGATKMTPWTECSVSLSEYANKSIHIAFRHHDSESNYMLMLDFISVSAKGEKPTPVCPIEELTVLNNYYEDPDVIRKGEGWTTEVYVKPLGASIDKLVYSSSAPDIASVDENGYVTGIKEGDAVITVQTPDGSVSDSYNIRVQGESFYFEDFESSVTLGSKGWGTRDGDGDGNKWYREGYTAEPYGYKCLFSSSASPLNPDNWIISAEFTVPSGINAAVSWYDDIYGGAECRLSENYTVYIAERPTSADDFHVQLFDGSTDGNNMRTADITDFAGKTVRLAFRHHDSMGGSGLLIDRISAYVAEAVPTPEPTVTPIPTEAPTDTPEPTDTPAPTDAVLTGDLNDDGTVNTADAVIILKYSAEMIDLDAVQLMCGDCNHDGNVNTADAVVILKYAAGIITEL